MIPHPCSQHFRRIRRADRARSQVRADKRTNIQLGMTSMAPSTKQCQPQLSVVDLRLAAPCMVRCRLPAKCNGSIPIAVKASPTNRESASNFATATNGLSPKIRVSILFTSFNSPNQLRSGWPADNVAGGHRLLDQQGGEADEQRTTEEHGPVPDI